MSPVLAPPATLDDLMRVEGKAELISGRIVQYMSSGVLHNRVSKRVLRSLDDHCRRTGVGEAFGDSLGYAMRPPMASGRESFSPDASYYVGSFPVDSEDFIDGSPTFAIAIRSKSDYGPAADAEYTDKRADYFEAGTLVVWDVDPRAETVVCYKADAPFAPVEFRPGDVADAEPAVPGWRMPVADLFG